MLEKNFMKKLNEIYEECVWEGTPSIDIITNSGVNDYVWNRPLFVLNRIDGVTL